MGWLEQLRAKVKELSLARCLNCSHPLVAHRGLGGRLGCIKCDECIGFKAKALDDD